MAEFIQTFIQRRKIYPEGSLHMHMLTLIYPCTDSQTNICYSKYKGCKLKTLQNSILSTAR